MRILDIIMSIPGIALAAVFVSILGNSVPSIIFAIGFMYTPQIARIVRANIVSEYGEDYVPRGHRFRRQGSVDFD